ncbi:uncharacterized protein METZ01_LOCUS393495, partial [marine metagenome]
MPPSKRYKVRRMRWLLTGPIHTSWQYWHYQHSLAG